jgi:hypothetical protein
MKFRIVVILAGLVLSQVHSQVSIAGGPSYRFRMIVDRESTVCARMNTIFNTAFRNMWNAPAFSPGDDPNYAAGSKYAYPLPPGVPHISEAVFRLRFAKWPTSQEFDAIPWRQIRTAPDAGDTAKIFSRDGIEYLMRMLIAYVDIDNDGRVDTLIKSGATDDYASIAHSKSLGFSETIYVLGGRKYDWRDRLTLSEFYKIAPRSDVNVLEGSFVRPFSYRGKTYVARYSLDLGRENRLVKKPPYLPREHMSVLSVSFPNGVRDTNGLKPMDVHVLCEYEMTQRKTVNPELEKNNVP